MAWEYLTYACGHKGREQFYGSHAERESLMAWKEARDCPACFQKSKDDKRASNLTAAEQHAKETGLPVLIGSDKQIKWAMTIRHNALIDANNIVITQEQFGFEIKKNNYTEEAIRMFRLLYDNAVNNRKYLESQTLASWWINNQSSVNSYVSDRMKDPIRNSPQSGGNGARPIPGG